MNKLLLLLCFCLVFYCTPSVATNYTVQCDAPGSTSANHIFVKLQLYMPEIDTVRGIFFYLNGGNMDSYPIADTNKLYRSMVLANKFCLLTGDFMADETAAYDYYTIQSWLADSVYMLVNKLAQISNHLELMESPFFLQGHSNGGSFSYNFSMIRPERVIGFTNLEGAALNSHIQASGLEVPGYTMAGAIDNVQPVNHTIVGFINNRPQGAPWSFAIDPNGMHRRNTDTTILFPYFRAIIKLRLPGTIAIDHPIHLLPIDQSKGWLGDNQTFVIAPDSCYYLDKHYASWFPSKVIAERWQRVVSGSDVTTVVQCGADTILQRSYFGQQPPDTVPAIFAPGLISVRGRSEFRFEIAADSTQAGFTSLITTTGYPPFPELISHFTGSDIANFQRLFWKNGKWTYPSQQLTACYLGGYTSDYSSIYYNTTDATQFMFSSSSDEGFSNRMQVSLSFDNPVYPSFTASGKMFFGDYLNGSVYYAEKIPDGYAIPILLPISQARFPFVSKDGSYIVFENGNDLFVSFDLGNNNWSAAFSLGDSVNTAYNETAPSLSPDGKYLFFSRANEPSAFRDWDTERLPLSNIYWISTTKIESLKKSFVNGISNKHCNTYVAVYPNPANDKLYVKQNEFSNATVIIYDLQGKEVLSKKMISNSIDISALSKGIYLVKLSNSEQMVVDKIIKE